MLKQAPFFFWAATSLRTAHARSFSQDLLNVVPLLLDGEWLELRFCPIDTNNRAAYEHVHRSRWSRFHGRRGGGKMIANPEFFISTPNSGPK